MTLILRECCAECEVFAYQSIRMLKKDKLKYKDFDLFISDVELPGEDTFGLLETLREKIPSLPILVVSMHKKNAVIRRCKDIGIKGYLLKEIPNVKYGPVEDLDNFIVKVSGPFVAVGGVPEIENPFNAKSPATSNVEV